MKTNQPSLLTKYMFKYCLFGNRGSSVSKVTDRGLDDQAIGVPSQAEAKHFSSRLCVETGSGTHRLLSNRSGGSFPGAKAWS
jgi:hypothetical protein